MSDLVDLLLPAASSSSGLELVFGTVVTSGGVTTVRVDNDTDPLPAPPVSMVPLVVGRRVAMLLQGRTLIVAGCFDSEQAQTLTGVNLNTVLTPGKYFFTDSCTNQPGSATGTGNYGHLEVLRDVTDVFHRVTLATGIDAAQYVRRYSLISSTWGGWKGARGGFKNYWAYGTFTQNSAWNAITGVPSTPDRSWGDTSWRTSPNDASAVFVTPGVYAADLLITFSRSGDGSGFHLAGKFVFTSAGWLRPAYLGLGQPNPRMIAGIQTNSGIEVQVEHQASVSANTTAFGVTFTVERIGD